MTRAMTHAMYVLASTDAMSACKCHGLPACALCAGPCHTPAYIPQHKNT